MPGLFSKGREKLKKDLMTARDAKEERIKQDLEQTNHNSSGGTEGVRSDVVHISDYSGEKIMIGTKNGGSKPMSRKLLIDSICYNIAVNAPIYRRLVSTEIEFVKNSIPWHVSCNGKRTIVSEDILGKSFNDILFLFIKEFVHVALGHKIRYNFGTDVIMTEERIAMLKIEKNILDNCIVLSGLLSSPGEFGVKESLCDVSPELKGEITSLFNSCSFEIGSTFWKDELSLKFMEDILRGDSGSFDNRRQTYFKDINYKLRIKEKIPSYMRRSGKKGADLGREIQIMLYRDILKDETRNNRSVRPDNPNKLNKLDTTIEQPKKPIQEAMPVPKDSPKKGDKSDSDQNSKENSSSEIPNKAEERVNDKKNSLNEQEKLSKPENKSSIYKSDGSNPDDFYDDELSGSEDYENDEYSEDELRMPEDESTMKDLSDSEKETGHEKSELDNSMTEDTDGDSQSNQSDKPKGSKPKKSEIGATKFGEDYNDTSGCEQGDSDMPDGYELLSGDERDCYERAINTLSHEDTTDFDSAVSDVMGEVYSSLGISELNELTEQMCNEGVDLLESSPREQLGFMLNKLNQFSKNSIKEMVNNDIKEKLFDLANRMPPTEEELAEARGDLQSLEQTMQERLQDNVALREAMTEWDVPEVQNFQKFENTDEPSSEGSDVAGEHSEVSAIDKEDIDSEPKINHINASDYSALYKSSEESDDESGNDDSIVEPTIVETKPYDFMDKAQYKDYLKETFDYYESFGQADAMSTGEYDTLRSEMITAASQGRSHGEDGGFASRLEKNEYAELFTMSTAWYEKARKMIMSCKPKKQNSYNRPNKKYVYQGITLQSPSTSGNVCDINQLRVYIDSSGSMSAKDMIIFKSIIKTASKLFPKDVEAFEFNTKVSQLRVVNGMIKEDPKTSGGTAIKCVLGSLMSMLQKDVKRTLVIVVSDGEFDWGDVSEFCKNYRTTKFLFMITSNIGGYYKTKYETFIKEISHKQVQTIFVDSVSENNAVVWR